MTSDKLYAGRIEVPIYYEDTDFTGHVFHPHFLKYCDRAREEFFGRSKLQALYQNGTHFVVGSAKIEYLLPCFHGQTLIIDSFVKAGRSPRIEFLHQILLNTEIAVSVDVELIFVDKKGRPKRLSTEVQEMIRANV